MTASTPPSHPLAPPPAPDIAPLRRAAGLVSLAAAIMAVAMLVFCFAGDGHLWLAPPLLIWVVSPPVLGFYALKCNLRVRAAWWIGLAGLGAVAAFQAWMTYWVFLQMLIFRHGYSFDGVVPDGDYFLVLLIAPLQSWLIFLAALTGAVLTDQRRG